MMRFACSVALAMAVAGFSTGTLAAQYHFTELGLRAGGGTNLPVPMRQQANGNLPAENRPLSPGWAYNADFFLSHYFCGKPAGYHIEVGYRAFRLREQRGSFPSYFGPFGPPDSRITMHYLQGAFYFKIRRFNYHRKTEGCLMAGPKMNVRIGSTIRPDNLGAVPFRPDADGYREVPNLIAGGQVSYWIRRQMGRNGSFFIVPAVDVYFTDNARTDAGLFFSSIYPSLNLGFTFWNSR